DRVIWVLLQHADSGQIKAGRAVDRIMRLRDPLGARLLAIDAADTPIAEWLVDHSPAHAVVLPYGLSDQSAGWRLLDAASELGVSLFAHPGKPSTRWIDPDPSAESDLSFIASNPRIACAVIELPVSPDALDALLAAAFRPMSADESGQWIARYRARHAAPARRRHGHAPDEV
ncbi:MAG TPA: hypothetical protein PKB10_00720, partial [Tepidisphaeraceae bacterium]|nr:hypothetical protein [Tepidisphaeraceae bacterium]